MRGSLTYQIQTVWKRIDGIGISKRDQRQESSLLSLDGKRPISNKVHSFQYKKEVLRTFYDVAAFARDRFKIKDLELLSKDIINAWLQEKLSHGIRRSTFKNYVAHLGKVLYALQQISEERNSTRTNTQQICTQEELYSIRQDLLQILPSNPHCNRAYENPKELVANLIGKYYVVGRLQLEYGLRIAEAAHIKASQLEQDRLTFQGKGGCMQHKELSPDFTRLLRDFMENGLFGVNHNGYRKALQQAAAITGQEYHGSHGLRYNFAQNSYYEELKINLIHGEEIKLAERSAKLDTSKKLGHHREKITGHYLG